MRDNLPAVVREFAITDRPEIPTRVRSDLSLLVAMSRLNGTHFIGWDLDKFIEKMRVTAVKSKDSFLLKGLREQVAFALRLATVDTYRVDRVREEVESRLDALDNAIESIEDANGDCDELDKSDRDVCDGLEKIIEQMRSRFESISETLDGIIDPSDQIDCTMIGMLEFMESEQELGIEVGCEEQGRDEIKKAIRSAIKLEFLETDEEIREVLKDARSRDLTR